MSLPDEVLSRAQEVIAHRFGLEFLPRRRADLERALIRAAPASSVEALDAFLEAIPVLPDDAAELTRLVEQLTIGETFFFRDSAFFEALEREILPSLIASRSANGLRRLRIWSAGCATGEEPYSVAILLDRLLPRRVDWDVTILATDINTHSLRLAREGRYRAWSLRAVHPWAVGRYLRPGPDGTWDLDRSLQASVDFAPLNLHLGPYPAPAMDLIICRNVLMYFTPEARREAARKLRQTLAPGGYLAVSPAEASAELFAPLRLVRILYALFFQNQGAEHDYPANVALPPPVIERAPRRSPPATYFGAAGSSKQGQDGAGAAPSAPIPLPPARNELEADTESADDLAWARSLADEGRLDEARALCEAVRARDVLDPEPHLLLAMICQEQGDLPAAIAALRRVIYLAPESAQAYFLLGSLLLRTGDQQHGRRAMKSVIDLLANGIPESAGEDERSTAGQFLETARSWVQALG